MTSSRIVPVIAGLALLMTAVVATTDDAVSLKEIMQGLRNDLVKIADGLLLDDFAMVAEGAQGIAQHPSIPAHQVRLVAAELGEEMPAFKQLDTRVHDLSVATKAAAEASDRDAAYRSYQEMTQGCLACHAAYKERVARVLGKPISP